MKSSLSHRSVSLKDCQPPKHCAAITIQNYKTKWKDFTTLEIHHSANHLILRHQPDNSRFMLFKLLSDLPGVSACIYLMGKRIGRWCYIVLWQTSSQGDPAFFCQSPLRWHPRCPSTVVWWEWMRRLCCVKLCCCLSESSLGLIEQREFIWASVLQDDPFWCS